MHHLEGHLLAPLLEAEPPPFPHVALLVSGGHTMLIEVQAIGAYRLLGQTRDDAAGEAFDKTAKLLGLPYPGGPELARIAARGRPGAFVFPRPMLDRPGLEFSFSGLKTAVLHAVRDRVLDDTLRADVARGVQEAIVECLCVKALRALARERLQRAHRQRRGRRQPAPARNAVASAGQPRRACLLSARGILYRQCGDDCGGGSGAAARRPAR